MTDVIVELEVCDVCRYDPGFGTIHMGCARCKRKTEQMDNQPRLVRVSESPLIYGVRETGDGDA